MVLGAGSTTVDILNAYSLEMTAKDVDGLKEARAMIPDGTSVSVTFLPGEHLDARLNAASTVKQLGLVPVPHLSARRLGSAEELAEFLSRLRDEVSIDRCFVVAGDPDKPMGPFDDALAVIKNGKLADYGIKQVGISGYPEGHPDITEAKLWQALRDKKAVLTDLGLKGEIITQFGFDAEPVFAWLKKVREEGVDYTVRVGLPGPASVKTLLRFAARCGVGASAKVLAKYGVSITKLLNTAGPDKLIQEFVEGLDPAVHGDVKFHLYPFGGFKRTAEWAHEFRQGA